MLRYTMTRIKGPIESLAEVQQLVAEGRIEFTRSARDDLAAHFLTARSGKAKAIQAFAALSSDDYDHSVHLPNPPAKCDIYGLYFESVQWYIKFYTDNDCEPPYDPYLQVVSFHEERGSFLLTARRKVVLP
jgi:hypothetical protein